MTQKELDNGLQSFIIYDQVCKTFERLSKEAGLDTSQTTFFMTFGTGILFGQMLLNAKEKAKKKAEQAETTEPSENVIDYEKAKQS